MDRSTINIIRYLFAIMFSFSGIVSLIGNDFNIGIQLLLFSISLYSFVYRFFWKENNISTLSKVIIQLIVPIVVFILLIIVFGG